MKRYFALYKRLLIANWNALIEYRGDFVTQIISSLVFSLNHVIIVLLLTIKVPTVYGWSREELILLAATYNVFIGVFHTFISRNLDHIADEIYFGKLDYILLKPIDNQLATMIWKINYVSLIRLLFGLLLTFYIVGTMHISVTIPMIAAYIVVIMLGVFMLYSFWLPFISLMIFNPRLSNIVILLFNITNVSRYPKEMFARLPLYVFIPLLPLALILTSPTKIVLQKFSYELLWEFLIVAVTLGLFARFVWKFSLRHYTSASS
ncbi:ABC-2 family transporter protein [Candidatus Gottesmanbacteria bacterium]|nr:ABC-2 family transporter protein [Candidatus Gottesmanbacteria bacterium]